MALAICRGYFGLAKMMLFSYEQAKTLFFINEEEACALALQAPQEYEVPPATRLLPSAFVRAWAINNMKEREKNPSTQQSRYRNWIRPRKREKKRGKRGDTTMGEGQRATKT